MKQESAVLKVTKAIAAAAVIAAIVTVLTESSSRLEASPTAEPVHSAMKACAQQPWPYLHCVGTSFGNPKVRVIEIR